MSGNFNSTQTQETSGTYSPSQQPPQISGFDIAFQNLKPVHQQLPPMISSPQMIPQQAMPLNSPSSQFAQGWLQNKTTAQFQTHADKLLYVNHYLKTNPSYFSPEEVDQYKRYQFFRKVAYAELFAYVILLIAGRNPVQSGMKSTFGSTRQRFVHQRMLFLNLGFATHLISVYRESQLRNQLAEKYFSQIPYSNPGQNFIPVVTPPIAPSHSY